MSDFVKKKIVEKLARFTKNLKPSDISLKFLTGKGSLNNLELNAQFLTEILQLPPWIQISRVVCDHIRAHVPFMKLGTEPIKFSIGLVVINVSTCTDEGPRKKHTDLLDKIGSNNPSSYGFTEKVIDGMRVDIRSILVHFMDATFSANLEMTDITIQSTTPDWQPVAELPHSRHKIVDEDSVVTFKMCSWSGVKIEGWSTSSTGSGSGRGRGGAESGLPGAVLRMIANETKIRIAFKRNMSDSSLMHTRISVHLGDVIWILTQSQLRALSRLIQTLMDAAVRTAQRTREEREKESEGSTSSSMESIVSAPGDTPLGHKLSHHQEEQRRQSKKKNNKTSNSSKKSKALSAKEMKINQRIADYRNGKLNIPKYEVIQNSFHLRSGKIDLQLCNDVIKEDGSRKVQGSMLIQLTELVVDVYMDQPVGVGRAQWNMANDLTAKNREWSKKLIERASKTQYMDLPSVNLNELRERGVVVRCSNFSVEALRSDNNKSKAKKASLLPIVTSDKKTFNIPDDMYNPAFQVSMTLYHYPDKCGSKFLLPRSNLFVYFSPIHINVHQDSCLWLVEYVNGVIQTVNVELALTVKDEGKAFIEEHKAKSVQVPQVPGIDFKVKVLFTKITLPVPEEMSGKGRPKALQVETSAIKAKNRTLDKLIDNDHFAKALKSLKRGWVFDSQETGQFPHYSDDLRSLPSHLQKLLNHKPRRGRSSTLRGADSSSAASASGSNPGETRVGCGSATNPEERGLKTEMTRTEGYHIHTSCVQLAFVDSYTHQATLRTTSFVDDFPVHVWIFIPPSLLDKSLTNQEAPSSSPTPPTAGSTGSGGGPLNEKVHDAMFSFIAHAPKPIKAQLERLQLLFIMRLKDSFTEFKNTLMQFLVIPSKTKKRETEKELNSYQRDCDGEGDETVAGLLVNEGENTRDRIREMATTGHPPQDKTATIHDTNAAVRGSTPSLISSSGEELSATISGCVLVESVEACILLPSILKTQSHTSSGRSSAGATSPLSPSTPTAGSVPSIAMTTQRAGDDVIIREPPNVSESERSLVEGGVSTFFSESSEFSSEIGGGSQTSLTVREEDMTLGSLQSGFTSQTGFSLSSGGSATPSPRISPTPSQTSLTSQMSQSGQLSLSLSSNMGHTLSPSITSLPTVIESSGDEMTSSEQLFHRRNISTPASLDIGPPTRSYSQGHLPPMHETASSRHLVSHGGNKSTASSFVGAARTTMAGWESQSERSSPVVHMSAIGGTQAVYRMQHESEVLWSELPQESGFVMVEKPLMDTGKTGLTRHIQDKPVEQGIPADAVEPVSSQSDSLVGEEIQSHSDSVPRILKSSSHSASSLLSPKKVPPPSSSRRSSKSSLSSRRLKVPTPPKIDPIYNLMIKVGGMCALPNIQANNISVRASISDVKLEEIEAVGSLEASPRKSKAPNKDVDCTDVVEPKVKARIVIGDKVKEFFPEDASHLDIVLIGKASDLDVSLLLPNALVMKDFFDDEFEAENPVPMHLRIENTSVVLIEEASHGPDHVKSMRIAVDRTDIHRGRKLLDHVDVFLERGSEVLEEMEKLTNAHSTETLHEDDENGVGGGSEDKTSSSFVREDERLLQSHTELVQSFNSFLKALEVHLSRAGEQHLPRDQQVMTVLRQIREKSQETTNRENPSSTGKTMISSSSAHTTTVDSPPSYYDTVSTFVASCQQLKLSPPPSPSPHGSTHDELIRLRRENERLRIQEMEYQRENAVLLETKESIVVQLADFDMVTEECKTVKEQLVAYKQVMEKQHEQMERLLNENTELQRKLALWASNRLH